MAYLTALVALVLSPLMTGAQDQAATNVTPKITATVDLTGPKETGGTPVVVDDATKQQLDALAANFQKEATDHYQLIIKTLKLEDKPASTDHVNIILTYAYTGVAATHGSKDGPTIDVSAKYALAHPKDSGLIVHEMVHVVQAYHHRLQGTGWLTEGIADYVRWIVFEPQNNHQKLTREKANPKGSYRTTAAFLNFVARKYDADLVPKLNAAMQDGTYTDDLFTKLTGKSIETLGGEWQESLGA